MESMGNKPRRRRSLTPEFKAEIVELCQRGDRSAGQVTRDFDLMETAVGEWVKQAERDAGNRQDGGLTSRHSELALSSRGGTLPFHLVRFASCNYLRSELYGPITLAFGQYVSPGNQLLLWPDGGYQGPGECRASQRRYAAHPECQPSGQTKEAAGPSCHRGADPNRAVYSRTQPWHPPLGDTAHG
jgi:transposase